MRSERVKVVLTGYFSRGNLGDDAIVDGLSRYLRERLANVCLELLPLPPSTALRSLPEYVKAIRAANWVVLAGGTHFHDYYGAKSWRLLAQFVALFSVARLSRTRVAFAGIGIGPLRTLPGRMAVRHLLNLSDSTTVRDTRSLRLAQSLKPDAAKAGFDLAFLCHERSSPQDVGQTKRLGLSPVAFHSMYRLDRAGDERMLEAFTEAIRSCADKGLIHGIDIFPFSRSGAYSDVSISQALATRLREHIDVALVECTSPARVRSRMRALSAFVGARYHSVVLAYQAGVPVLPILYHEKCAALVDELGFDSGRVIPPECLSNVEVIRQRIEDLLIRPALHIARLTPEDAFEKAAQTAEALVQEIESQEHLGDESTVSPALPGFWRPS